MSAPTPARPHSPPPRQRARRRAWLLAAPPRPPALPWRRGFSSAPCREPGHHHPHPGGQGRALMFDHINKIAILLNYTKQQLPLTPPPRHGVLVCHPSPPPGFTFHAQALHPPGCRTSPSTPSRIRVPSSPQSGSREVWAPRTSHRMPHLAPRRRSLGDTGWGWGGGLGDPSSWFFRRAGARSRGANPAGSPSAAHPGAACPAHLHELRAGAHVLPETQQEILLRGQDLGQLRGTRASGGSASLPGGRRAAAAHLRHLDSAVRVFVVLAHELLHLVAQVVTLGFLPARRGDGSA